MEQKGLDFGETTPRVAPRRRPLTVGELTDRIQGVLETDFPDLWVEGEVSNLKIATSGHWYFSLKDDRAQLRAVVWKTATRLIRFRPRDGMHVLARGAVSVYPPRGEYQLSVVVLEPLGKGALQQAFEDLRRRLEGEGLFDAKKKRPLPILPRRIGVVTSPTGAAIHDLLRVLSRRFSNLDLLIYPARVQGPEAPGEIVDGIRALNRLADLDVIIVARGGGSLEDLWAFNEEAVARALAASRLPTISAVGHETDYTISDFVADLRAPTPSAAAQWVVETKEAFVTRLASLEDRRNAALRLRTTRIRARVQAVTSHRVFEAERGRLKNQMQRTADLLRRSGTGIERLLERARVRVMRADERAASFRWDRQVADRRERLGRSRLRLDGLVRARIDAERGALSRLAGKVESLSPLAVLGRGYALVWDETRKRLVRQPEEVAIGDDVRLRVHGGELGARITSRDPQ